MKTTVLKISIIFLLLSLMGAGCEKDEEIEKFTEKEFFKFSDFGCENEPWHLKSEYVNNHYIITSQQEFEKYIESDCTPQIDFTKYLVIVGSKSFTTGASIYKENVEENATKLVLTITFLKNISTVAIGLSYHVVIKRKLGENDKSVEVIEIVKEHE